LTKESSSVTIDFDSSHTRVI